MTIIINKKNLVCSPKLLVVTRPLLATPENANNGLVTTKSFGEQTKFFLLMMIVINLSSFLIDLAYFCAAIF
ncbi:MAG: hypothetical protein IKF08_00905 [Lactococcus sp.]|nr:hypothetical protein [Lactococcus sp.]